VSLNHLSQKAEEYLNKLCGEISSRRVGSQGNREATATLAFAPFLLGVWGIEVALQRGTEE